MLHRTRSLISINIEDRTSIEVQPQTINYKYVSVAIPLISVFLRDNIDTITVTVTPKVEWLSSARAVVMVTPRVSFDVERLLNGTLRPRGSVKCLPSSLTLMICEKLSFQFKPKEPNFGIDQQSPNPDDPKMAPLR